MNCISSFKQINTIEVGPGEGALTKYLLAKTKLLKLIEIDKEAVEHLKSRFPEANIVHKDFLTYELNSKNLFKFIIVGNFPYNISTQILFKVLENRNRVPELVGMFQKEVAERICSLPNSKKYGIPSVLLQAFYNCEELFDVEPKNFRPIPKVNSTVIKLSRKQNCNFDCDYKKFMFVVKSSFLHRRKKMKNSLKNLTNFDQSSIKNFANKRAEELTVNNFIQITKVIYTQ